MKKNYFEYDRYLKMVFFYGIVAKFASSIKRICNINTSSIRQTKTN